MGIIISDSALTKNPKFFECFERLKTNKLHLFWMLHHLWYWASEFYPDGKLDGVSESALAHVMEWSREPSDLVNALHDSGFLDKSSCGWEIHDWSDWRTDATRMRSCRKRKPDKSSEQMFSSTLSSVDVVVAFPVVGTTKDTAKTWGLTTSHLKKLEEIYPGVDVKLESKKSLLWLESNPTRRKTERGMPKFLQSWMERAQNSGRGYRPKTSAEKDAEFDAMMRDRDKIEADKKKIVEDFLNGKQR